MRIDKFLKNSRIIKRRTVAKEACDGGRVEINGRTVKAGADVHVGDEITVKFGGSTLKIHVNELIENVRKDDALLMYDIISREKTSDDV